MAKQGKGARGVEHPIPEDMALQGDTRHELHTKSLPRKGPVIGPTGGKDSEFRVEGTGEGVN